jgi:hypothetical protein
LLFAARLWDVALGRVGLCGFDRFDDLEDPGRWVGDRRLEDDRVIVSTDTVHGASRLGYRSTSQSAFTPGSSFSDTSPSRCCQTYRIVSFGVRSSSEMDEGIPVG